MVNLKTFAVFSLSLPVIARSSLVDDILHAIENAVTCVACHALFVPLAEAAHRNDTVLTNVFLEACKAIKVLNLYDVDVCQGIVRQQLPVLAQNLRNISPFNRTSTSLCNAFLGLCPPAPVIPHSVTFPKPAPSTKKIFASKGSPSFKVAHFTDAHVDREYTPGKEANCKKPICCRDYPDYPTASTPAGKIASIHCDTSPALAHSMLQAIPSTKFTIFTGDVVDTGLWSVDKAHNLEDINLFNNEMANFLKPGSLIYPVIGNHESVPANLFPRNTTIDHASDLQWVFDAQASGWSRWLDEEAQDQVRHLSGSYAQVVPGTNLRIISINTAYWYKPNFYLYDSDKFQADPNGILEFMMQQLQTAEDAGQRAWIIGHMAPGDSETMWDQSNIFDQIVQRYRDTIAAQFYGHSHMDQFEIAYSDYSNRTAENAVSIAMIAPSLTTRQGNPAFRIYEIDPDTYEIMDAITYRGDLMDPSFQINPTWSQYYSARQTWGPLVGWPEDQPLTPTFWHKVTEVFEKNDAAFHQYVTFLNRGIRIPTCDATCKQTTICGLRAQRAQDNCAPVGVHIPFGAGKESSPPVQFESCEGLRLVDIMSTLPRAFAQIDTKQLRKNLNEVLLDSQTEPTAPHTST